MSKMTSSVDVQSLPDDVSLRIVSSLQVFDVCSLGGCSRFWRELCDSDPVWECLFRGRWPEFSVDRNHQSDTDARGWKEFYLVKHNEMGQKAASVCNFFERCVAFESLEVRYYLKAIEDLNSMEFGFKDIQMFFLKPDVHVLLNLIGLHYCISSLSIPAECIVEALDECKISERKVCVQWWKLGLWFHGFRLRDELHSRNISLADLSKTKEEDEIFGVLQRGTMHEVLRVRVSASKPASQPWYC